MKGNKTERLYPRVTPADKKFLQAVADEAYDGNITSIIDQYVEDLKVEYPHLVDGRVF